MTEGTKPPRHFTRNAIILAVTVLAFLYLRPLPSIEPTLTFKDPELASKIQLPWPRYGQAALGAQGFGVLETHGKQEPAPTASVAKVMTAYAVLKQKPLKLGQQGPKITITQHDVDTYNDYYSKGGSIAKVVKGEKISEYRALQAMLLPSANNFADLLANWVFGSLDKYIVYANNQAKILGLKDTTIADASGFSPQTVSTARDLVLLGQAALKDPVIAQIVAQEKANIPEAGEIHNVNWLLNMDHVNGIKTGDTDQAGGCYLFSSKRSVGGHEITFIGAIMGAPHVNKAILDARPLIAASDKSFKIIQPIKAGQVVGNYRTKWGDQVQAVAKNNLSLVVWQNQSVHINAKLNPQNASKNKGEKVGKLTVQAGQKSASTDVVLAQKINKPSWRWRIFDR